MKQLLLKDFLTIGKTLKAYALFLCLCLLLAIPGVFHLSMVTTMTSLIFIMLPIGIFPQDEEEPPLCHKVVTARYLLVLLMALMAAAFGLSAGVFMSIVGTSTAEEALSAVLASISTGLFIADILLPVSYKLGAQRARPYLYPVVLVPLLGLFGRYTPTFSAKGALSLPDTGVLGALSLLGFGISYFISCRIAAPKEQRASQTD